MSGHDIPNEENVTVDVYIDPVIERLGPIGRASVFPISAVIGSGGTFNSHGITKRELFAAMAMQGMCAAEDHEGSRWDPVPLAKVAVMRADALLSALKEVQP